MIYNLISDLTKQIWINLELYFKVMNFLIFRVFYRFLGIFSEFFVNFLGIF